MLIIAHRGASAYEPENTLRAIEKALDFHADMIEIDVRMSKDNQIVVIHDDTVNRTTNGIGRVVDLTLEKLKKLDAGKGERIPTFEEVINYVKEIAILVVEIKVTNIEKSVVKIVEREGIEKGVMITSFYHQILKNVKELNPIIRTGVIFKCHPIRASELALNADANALLPDYKYISKEMVEEASTFNLEIFPWTVDDPDKVNGLIRIGVNGIVTNKPDIRSRI